MLAAALALAADLLRWQRQSGYRSWLPPLRNKSRHVRLGFGADLCFILSMVYEELDSPETPQEEASAWKLGPAGILGAFAAGVLVGGALTVGLFIVSRTAMSQLEKGSTRPRRLLIGNLEIEERGDDSRIHRQ